MVRSYIGRDAPVLATAAASREPDLPVVWLYLPAPGGTKIGISMPAWPRAERREGCLR